MEKMRKLIRDTDRDRESVQCEELESPGDAATEQRGAGSVQVISGASVQTLPLAGLQVAQARDLVSTILHIDPRHPVLVNGLPAQADQPLVSGDVLEFVHHAGEKGAGGEVRIEITGSNVSFRHDHAVTSSAPLDDFLKAVVSRSDWMPIPEAIPEGVRFVRRRGETVIVVMEEKPQLRSVRWLMDDSPAPFGRGATYGTAQLAFPYIVIVVAFRGGGLTGHQQCFYRTAPLRQLSDPLLLPNLFNVASGYGMQCWLCLAGLRKNLAPLPWEDKVREVRKHFWGAGFNQSSELHEGMSYWQAMRTVDARVANLAAWERESKKDPLFPLQVGWKASGKSVGQVTEEMMASIAPGALPTSAVELAQLVTLTAKTEARKRRLIAF